MLTVVNVSDLDGCVDKNRFFIIFCMQDYEWKQPNCQLGCNTCEG